MKATGATLAMLSLSETIHGISVAALLVLLMGFIWNLDRLSIDHPSLPCLTRHASGRGILNEMPRQIMDEATGKAPPEPELTKNPAAVEFGAEVGSRAVDAGGQAQRQAPLGNRKT
jgi:hypothetical protein